MGKKSKKRSKEDRFAAAETRPQFRSLPKHQSKVVLDERFSSVLTDPRFQLEGKDQYGRGKKKQAVKEELSAFYTIEEGKDEQKDKATKDETESESESDNEKPTTATPVEKDDDSDDEKHNEDPASRIAYLTALSRGELAMSSSSEDEDSSQSSEEDDEEEGEDPVYGTAGVLDPSARLEEQVEFSDVESPYLVACNLDWENVRAVDIYSILASFVPPAGVKKVQVFQSDFGMERMAKDKVVGPSNIWKRKKTRRVAGDQGENDDDSADDEEEDQNDSDDSHNEEDDDGEDSGADEELALDPEETNNYDESDFDPEKLRAYEASKLKYFFAVVEFVKAEYADIAYREVDGMEFEHSSSAIDLRTLPAEEVEGVVTGRPMRDEATSIPSNYEPPEFIVSALQQTNVQCTWDQGDVERERKLTKYGSKQWQNISEAEDLRAYLASDASSDDESDDDKATKGSKLRKLLGLDSGDEAEGHGAKSDEDDSSSGEDNSDEEGGKTLKFIPGSKSLEEKIRSKLDAKSDDEVELTPWQKYQEKRKQKRKERKLAAKNRGLAVTDTPVGRHKALDSSGDEDDDFFTDNDKSSKSGEAKGKKSIQHSNNQELELLLAGENEEEEARDFDIRGIQRMEKNKDKKLRGSRKRKEDKIAADVSGKDFKVDIQDKRFAAVLDGTDDRFGIDKTDPNFRDTSAMREILSEQTKRRKKKRKKQADTPVAPNVNVEENTKSAGASALSALVQKLKTQVS